MNANKSYGKLIYKAKICLIPFYNSYIGIGHLYN